MFFRDTPRGGCFRPGSVSTREIAERQSTRLVAVSCQAKSGRRRDEFACGRISRARASATIRSTVLCSKYRATMARFEDAVAGWEVFRQRGGRVSRTQLNQALRAQGRRPIANRTFLHYQKLMRLGYSDYVSINRLDLRHANPSVFDISDRSRYLDREIADPGRLVIPRGTELIVLTGTILTVSEGFAVLRVDRTDDAMKVVRSTRYNKGVLIFEDVGVERAVQASEGISRGSKVDLLLEFRSLLELDLLFEESPFPQSTSTLTVDLGQDAPLFRVLDVFHTTFDLLESVRGFVDVLATSAMEDGPRTPTIRLHRLQFSSPIEFVIIGAITVFGTAGYVIKRVATAVSQSADAAARVQSVVHEGRAEERRQELHDVQIRSLQLDNLKKAIEVASLVDELRPSMSEVLGVQIPELDPPKVARLEALKDQAVEAATELQAQSDQEVSFEETVTDDEHE